MTGPARLLCLLSASSAFAAVDYSRDIQPVLAEHCFHCHGKDDSSRKGRLRLDERDLALKGGKNDGPAIVPGQPDKSPLLARILTHDEDEVMPPAEKEHAVKPADVAKLKQWIQEGAEYAGHWAFEVPRKVNPKPETRRLKTLPILLRLFEIRISDFGLPRSTSSSSTASMKRTCSLPLPPHPKHCAGVCTLI